MLLDEAQRYLGVVRNHLHLLESRVSWKLARTVRGREVGKVPQGNSLVSYPITRARQFWHNYPLLKFGWLCGLPTPVKGAVKPPETGR
jgi:hypothetical protein